MRAFYYDQFWLPHAEQFPFPVEKYYYLYRRVAKSGLVAADDLQMAPAVTRQQILRVHRPDYLERLVSGCFCEQEFVRLGVPWSPQLVERVHFVAGGTIAACRAALQDGFSSNLGGGTHHAYPNHGEGFCLLNDVAIAAGAMQAEGLTRRILIVDCDAHQGNGTAAIFANDGAVFTYSIHCEMNYPIPKERSDLDVPLPVGCDDAAYLHALGGSLPGALAQARPDLVIYLAGADPYLQDRFGRLGLTKAGLAQRDRLVFDLCSQFSLPVAVVMGGGYARQVKDIVDIHFQTLSIGAEKMRSARRGLP